MSLVHLNLRSSFFIETVTIERPKSGGFINGEYCPPAQREVLPNIVASAQTATKETVSEAGGDINKEHLMVYSETELQLADRQTETQADIIKDFRGADWKLVAKADWSNYQYYAYLAEQLDERT